jgi:hypothetical protein
MYNSLVEKCFKDCVDSFRRKDLDNSEEKVEHGLTICQESTPPNSFSLLLMNSW